MTGSTRTSATAGELPGLVLAAGVGVLGALVILGSDKPLLLVLAPIGMIGMTLAARRPLVALVLMVVIEATNLSGVMAARGGIPVFQASVALGVLAVWFALRDPQARARLNAWTAICAGLLAFYLATQAVATVGSTDVFVSLDTMRRSALDCLFVMLVLVLIQLTARPWMAAGAIVIPLAVLSVLTVIDQVAFAGTASFGGFSTVTTASGEAITTLRFGGPLPDSNFWGRHLIMGLPLAAALLTRALRSRSRWAIAGWALAIMAQLAGVYLTQSRGTFVAAAIAIGVWFLASGRSVRRWGLVSLPVAALMLLIPGIGNRLVTAFEDVTRAQRGGHIDPSVLGRLAAQQEAGMMWEERPAFGFGPGTFSEQVINFAGRVPTAVREPTDAPHNLYAELLAETGLMGLLGWVVLVGGFLTVLVLRVVAHPRARDRVLTAAACAAIIAWSASSIALHLAYFRTFGLVLALAGGLAPAWPVAAATMRGFLRDVAVWLAAGLVGLAAFWVYLSANSSSVVTASQRMTVLPVGPTDGWYSYALDIRSRIELLTTFAILMQDQRSSTTVDADPVRGLLTITATADTATQARDDVQIAAARAATSLSTAIGFEQYTLVPVAGMQVGPAQKRAPVTVFVAGGVGAVAAVVAGILLSGWVVRRRTDELDDEPTTEPVLLAGASP